MAEGVLWSASYGRGSGVFNFQACSLAHSLDPLKTRFRPCCCNRSCHIVGVERLGLPNQYSSCWVHFPNHSPNEPLPRPTETSIVHRIEDDLWSWVHYRLLPGLSRRGRGRAGMFWEIQAKVGKCRIGRICERRAKHAPGIQTQVRIYAPPSRHRM